MPAWTVEKLAALLVELQEDVADLRRCVERRPARRAMPRGWTCLKDAAAECGFTYECLRQWAASGQIVARRQGGQWIVNVASVKDRAAR